MPLALKFIAAILSNVETNPWSQVSRSSPVATTKVRVLRKIDTSFFTLSGVDGVCSALVSSTIIKSMI